MHHERHSHDCTLQGRSGVSLIDSFDTAGYSTRIAGQIREFACNGFVNKKMERRLDDTIKYIIVAGKNVRLHNGLLPLSIRSIAGI